MSKYSEKVAARRIQAQIDLAVRITDGGQPAHAPQATKRPKTPPPEQRGILVDLGALPANCARAFEDAAAALDRAAAFADEMRVRASRSIQSGEAQSAFGLASTVAPKLRAQSFRLERLPRPKEARSVTA
jgi:hypothetical protein